MANIFLTYLGISATVGAVVLLILLASPLINRRYAAKWKYYIWIFLAIRLLIPLSGMYHNQPKSQPTAAVSEAVQAGGAAVYRPIEEPRVQPRRFVVEIPVEATGQIAKTPDTTTVRPKLSVFDIVFSAWIAGIIIFAAVPVLSVLHYKYRITHSGKMIEAGEEYEIFLRMKSSLRIKRNIRLIRYSKAASPMIIGFIKPALVLPCDEFSTEDLQFIIRHELIHLKRGDVYIKLLCVLANAVHWFNPIVWIMRREASIDMELSCDEGVIKGKSSAVKRAYTETLMSSLSRQSSKGSLLTTQFYGGKKTMKKRFTNILAHTAKKNGAALLVWAMVLAIISGSMVGCRQTPPKAAPTAEYNLAEDSVRLMSYFGGSYPGSPDGSGELYRRQFGSSPELLTYIDFDTMVYKPVCADPDCGHGYITADGFVNDSCVAQTFDIYPCIIDSKLYGFEYNYGVDERGYKADIATTVWMANADGSDMTKIDTIDVGMSDYNQAALIGSTVFFIGEDRADEYEENEASITVHQYAKYYLCSYDFAKREFVNYGFLGEGYSGSASVLGRYNGGLYASLTTQAEKFDYVDIFSSTTEEMTEEEIQRAYTEQAEAYKDFVYEYEMFRGFRLDLESGEITSSDLPLSTLSAVIFITDDIYGYITEDEATEHGRLLNISYGDGEVKTYNNALYYCTPVNGYLFFNDKAAVNIETGELRALKEDAIPQNFTVHAYHDGKYILVKDLAGREYQAISEEELFKD